VGEVVVGAASGADDAGSAEGRGAAVCSGLGYWPGICAEYCVAAWSGLWLWSWSWLEPWLWP
jgi:hypothetical protein